VLLLYARHANASTCGTTGEDLQRTPQLAQEQQEIMPGTPQVALLFTLMACWKHITRRVTKLMCEHNIMTFSISGRAAKGVVEQHLLLCSWRTRRSSGRRSSGMLPSASASATL
jgi:hypothetical protein